MSDVENVKSRIDIVQLIGESVALKKAGRNFKGLCPFHSEKTPSFMVNPERQNYHCFGCGEGGDVLEFVMKREAADFPEALRMLAGRAGVELTERGGQRGDSKAKQRLFDINEQTGKYFEAALAHGAGNSARAYLDSRGISAETAAAFRVGFAPDDFDALPAALKKKKFTDKELIDAGVAIAGQRGPYARFRGRLMIPITDATGLVRGFTGRILEEEKFTSAGSSAASGVKKFHQAKYINTPETTLYHKGKLVFALNLAKQAIIDADAAVVVEGQMDALAAHQAGTANAVATSGTALTEDQLKQLTRFSKTVILALDTDSAGQKALGRIAELVGDRDIELKVADLGDAKDPDELIQKHPKRWEQALTYAKPVIEYLLDRGAARHKKPYSRAAINEILELVLPVLRYRRAIDQDYYVEQLASSLGVEKSSVRQQLKKAAAAAAPPRPVAPSTVTSGQRSAAADDVSIDEVVADVSRTPAERVTQRMLGLVVTTPALTAKLDQIDARIFSDRYRAAAASLQKSPENSYTDETDEHMEATKIIDMCSLAAAEYEPMAADERAAEFDRLYARLKSFWVKQHQPKLLAAIKRADSNGDRDRRNRLMEEYTTLTRRIAHGEYQDQT